MNGIKTDEVKTNEGTKTETVEVAYNGGNGELYIVELKNFALINTFVSGVDVYKGYTMLIRDWVYVRSVKKIDIDMKEMQ